MLQLRIQSESTHSLNVKKVSDLWNKSDRFLNVYIFLTLKGLLLNLCALEYNSGYFKQLLCFAHLAYLVQL